MGSSPVQGLRLGFFRFRVGAIPTQAAETTRPTVNRLSTTRNNDLLGAYATPVRYNRMSAMPFVNHTIVEVNQFRHLAVQMLTGRTRDGTMFYIVARSGRLQCYESRITFQQQGPTNCLGGIPDACGHR